MTYHSVYAHLRDTYGVTRCGIIHERGDFLSMGLQGRPDTIVYTLQEWFTWGLEDHKNILCCTSCRDRIDPIERLHWTSL